MRILGALLSYFAFLLAAPFLLTHPKVRAGFLERCGFYGQGLARLGLGPRLWLHGASAGDVLALLPTVRELRRRLPGASIALSTITNSGRAMAERERSLFDAVFYQPYDVPWCTRRAVREVRPDVLVLEYTELWPQLILAASDRGAALALHNGRLGLPRLRRYRWMFRIVGNLFEHFTLLLMRDEREADAARRLRAPEAALRVTGNTKFDNLKASPDEASVTKLRAALGIPEGALVWVAGSTHEGEEEPLLDIFARLRSAFPDLVLVVAPRYIERAERIASAALKLGLTTQLRSTASGTGAQVSVLDTIGELASAYSIATLVFVGGSFVRRGGQNILEPAAAARPVLFGPHMHNFHDAVQVLLGRGGIQVASYVQLERVLVDLLRRPEQCRELGNTAQAQVIAVRGAAARNAELIAGLVTSRAKPTQAAGRAQATT